MTIRVMMVDPNFWAASSLFNPNAFSGLTKFEASTCGDRLAILAHSVEIVRNEPGLDRSRLIEQIRKDRSFVGFKPNPEKPAVLIFHNLSFVSGLYSVLVALKSLLDFFARLIGKLLLSSSNIKAFNKGVYHGQSLIGGKFLKWLEDSVSSSFGNREALISVFQFHLDDWLQEAVTYRDAAVHHGYINGMTEVSVPLDKDIQQLQPDDLFLPSMPNGTLVTDYCEGLLNNCRRLLRETLQLLPEIDFGLLSLDTPRSPDS